MQDHYKELMFRSFKDAMDVVADYNEWAEEAFGGGAAPVPPSAVPQVATLLYQSRVQARAGEADFDLPDFDDRMYD